MWSLLCVFVFAWAVDGTGVAVPNKPTSQLVICDATETGDDQHSTEKEVDCPAGEFCGYVPSKDDILRGCVPCYQCRSDSEYATFGGVYSNHDELLASCTKKCNCSADNDCGPGSYCDQVDSTSNPPETAHGRCRNCVDTDACTGPPNIFSHEKKDLCISSLSCGERGERSFCSTIPSGNGRIGVCTSCDWDGCTNVKLQNPLEESCAELCPPKPPQTTFCTYHEDCGHEGQWCNAKKRCNPCSPYCFPAVSQDLDKTPMSLECPSECCGWDFKEVLRENGETTKFTVRPCTSGLRIDGYWNRGDRQRWSVDDFVRYATKCDVSPSTPTHTRREATLVDCSTLAGFDKSEFRLITVALIATDPDTRTRTFLDESFPHTQHYFGTLSVDDNDRLSSGRPRSTLFILLIVILTGMGAIILLFVIAVIMFLSSRRTAAMRRSPTGEEGSRLQHDLVPRSLVIDIMFPEQRLVEEEGYDDENRPVCTICLRQIEPGDTILTGGSCDHCYHRECIFEWMKCGSAHDFCPNCRRPLWSQSAYGVIRDSLLALSGLTIRPASISRRVGNGQD